MLGLPDHIDACLFDLDGVLTSTAQVHAAAWKEMLDEFLENWASRSGDPEEPFDLERDYQQYVDGKPRLDGVRSFLASRDIHLPEGTADDPPSGLTVNALGTRKNILVLNKIAEGGVRPYPGAVRYLRACVTAEKARALVSSSANAGEVVEVAGLADLLQVRVDGLTIVERGLAGKPAPDTFLAAARELGVPPERAAVFEDAEAGVAAGRAGGFGYVVGIDRVGHGHGEALRAHGADVVVADLGDLLTSGDPSPQSSPSVPSSPEHR
ncbi:beta-phosphoglucomutase family hydrolase [Frankia sp. CNm7]|uniref:Beta-phosphoglucomutase n=1 Tax=Frankia nepalensis TaxID=1836974 RepID=A0A937RAW3_9ACTN|nr:beta-phosphoglucomutase family hydrolase [Frankia nepalensis]MBL7496168.1 beta-phosphoglucomutase family hydrolase [Frankia nepalensis]MBL7508894.1 beta-phosphoglucomutase family hydrolase [Frankia nepalensis]MBL7516734.1 beta-phosphoglucomutase family hydrolase [Frankia nepalensis]MBL7628671.1 beta-phosphoglucomutase family hydrolase [Frankia nepalensis]